MLKHQEHAFTHAIDQVVRFGAVTLHWDDLHSWFNAEEIDQTIWRAIYAKFNELWSAYEWGDLPELHAMQLDSRVTLMRDAAEGEAINTFTEDGDLDESEEEESEEDEDEDLDESSEPAESAQHSH
jgi:hypothetical protein